MSDLVLLIWYLCKGKNGIVTMPINSISHRANVECQRRMDECEECSKNMTNRIKMPKRMSKEWIMDRQIREKKKHHLSSQKGSTLILH